MRTGEERYPISPERVVRTERSTCLTGVATVEHCLSALTGLGVTDFEIEMVAGEEMPGMDGSSLEFVRSIESAGLEQCGTVFVDGPFSRIFLQEDQIKIGAAKGEGRWRYDFDAGTRFLGKTSAEYKLEPITYTEQIAPARTFAFSDELPHLESLGLGQGLDSTSAVIVGQDDYEFPARFPDEPARHKLLDLIGDLALCGVPLAALDVVAERSGHRTNVLMAQKLAASIKVVRED